MSKWLSITVGLLAAATLFGQRPAARSYGLGFGNVVFPGGISPLKFPSNAGFATRLGATVAGVPYTGAPSVPGRLGSPRLGRGFNGRGFGYGANSVIVPVPYYIGGDYGYSATVQAPPNVTVVLQPPAGQAPVVFNQNYMPGSGAEAEGQPVAEQGDSGYAPPPNSSGLRTYEAPMPYQPDDPAEAGNSSSARPRASARGAAPGQSEATTDVMDQKATIYLIAFKDQTIQAAYACWVDGNTLHYVTVQGSHNRATLDLIDRDLSDKLNRDRGVELPLPGRQTAVR